MTELDFLKKQTIESHEWTLKVLGRTELDQWSTQVPGIESNLLWQAGHITLTMHFHVVYLMRGSQEHIYTKVDLKKYAQLFNMGTHPADCIGKISPEQVLKDLQFMQSACIEMMETFTEEELSEPLKDRKVRHPFARTKYQSLSWNFKHIMYHCGQIAVIQRMMK